MSFVVVYLLYFISGLLLSLFWSYEALGWRLLLYALLVISVFSGILIHFLPDRNIMCPPSSLSMEEYT